MAKYFKLKEFKGYNTKDKNAERNIQYIADNILDKARIFYGKPIYILNTSSDGCQVKFTTKSEDGNKKIFEYIKSLNSTKSIDLLKDGISITIEPSKEIINESKGFISDCLVCLDSGHGKDVPGKRSPDQSLLEWEWAREIKYRLAEKLESNKIARCYDVNPEDVEPGLSVRANRANNAIKKYSNGKGIFVSIHCNAAGNGKWMNARGWSVWTTKGQNNSDILAEDMWEEANNIFPKRMQKMRADMSDGDHDYESNFTVIWKAAMPAVLVENMFQDNKEDVEYLLSEQGKQDCVDVMYNGIKKYLASKS